MSYFHPKPTDPRISAPREDLDEPCSCGGPVQRYKVLRSEGWRTVERCRTCFTYRSIVPARQSYVPLTDGWDPSSIG